MKQVTLVKYQWFERFGLYESSAFASRNNSDFLSIFDLFIEGLLKKWTS